MSLVKHRTTVAAVSVALCGILTLSACSSSSSPSSAGTQTTAAAATIGTGGTLDSVCKAGEAEGSLSFQDTTDPEIFAKEIAPFEAKYPGIKMNFGSLRPQDSVARIVSEKQAHHAIDVDATAIDMPSAAPLIQQGLVQPVDWTALGVSSDDVLTNQGVQFVRTQRIILGLGYNTTKLQASDLPDTWDELINSKWAGKIIVDPRGQYLSGLGIAWGKDKAVAWYKKFLSTDKPQVVKGATASVQEVTSGQVLLTTSSHDAEINEQKAKGAPVAIKYLDVVPTQDHYTLVVKGAAHPNAAACFLGWYASDEGAASQLKYEFKGNEEQPSNMPAGAKLAAVTNEADSTVQDDTATEFAKLSSS
ncbi:MAG: transporter substrate-binding protein [Frankiales bacterium]|nr:transporter substrate-binding protein [Frankiales bacterium]